MRIDHLIDGRSVASAETFETRDPATQEVLAEVSSGGLNEVNQAVAAAKAAFPKWAATPTTDRARIMRKLGELITKHVPASAETEPRDCGQTILKPASNWYRERLIIFLTLQKCARAWMAIPIPRPPT